MEGIGLTKVILWIERSEVIAVQADYALIARTPRAEFHGDEAAYYLIVVAVIAIASILCLLCVACCH